MDLQRNKNRFLRVYHNESLMIPVKNNSMAVQD